MVKAKPKTIAPGDESLPAHPVGEEPLSFEASIAALGRIVEQLERGDLPLEESLNLFEHGVRLSKDAQAKLDHAEKRVEMLLGFDDEGEPITTVPESTHSR